MKRILFIALTLAGVFSAGAMYQSHAESKARWDNELLIVPLQCIDGGEFQSTDFCYNAIFGVDFSDVKGGAK